jgi:hypothetical protein
MGRKKEIKPTKAEIYKSNMPRRVLSLDISTACIGISLICDNGTDVPEILEITHVSPKVSSKIKGIEALILRKNIFENEYLLPRKNIGITDVVIEEPLLSSNNVNTVATLLRFNGMISEAVYRVLGIVPEFISSYNARMYSFPHLVSIRKFNKRGDEYPISHIKKDLKDNHLVLFGSYPFDIDKKNVMMNAIKDIYPDIPWVLDKNGELRKENYDMCDSLVCALAYANITKKGEEKPMVVSSCLEKTNDGGYCVEYTTQIWGQQYDKKLTLSPIYEE